MDKVQYKDGHHCAVYNLKKWKQPICLTMEDWGNHLGPIPTINSMKLLKVK